MEWNLERIESLDFYADPEDEDDEPLTDRHMPRNRNLGRLKHFRSSAALFNEKRSYLTQLTTLYLDSTTAYIPFSASNLFVEIIGLPNLIPLCVAKATFAVQTVARPTSPMIASKLRHFRCGDTALAKLVSVDAL